VFLHEVVEAYVTQLAANGRSIHTQRQIQRHGRLLVQELGDPQVERLRHETVAAFFASDAVARTAAGAPRRASSANALRSSVRGILTFAHARCAPRTAFPRAAGASARAGRAGR